MQVKCPQCRQEIEYDSQSPFRPFCSERCRLIDLGEWANEERRISDPHPFSIDEEIED